MDSLLYRLFFLKLFLAFVQENLAEGNVFFRSILLHNNFFLHKTTPDRTSICDCVLYQGFHYGPSTGQIECLQGLFCLSGLTIMMKIFLIKTFSSNCENQSPHTENVNDTLRYTLLKIFFYGNFQVLITVKLF